MEELNLEEIGSRLSNMRVKLGLSQLELSDQCDINRTFLSRLENGKQSPSFDSLWRISATFGVSIDWILWGNGSMMIGNTHAILSQMSEENVASIKKVLDLPPEVQKTLFTIFSDLINFSGQCLGREEQK